MGSELEIDAYRQGHELFVVLRGRLTLHHALDAKARLSGLFLPQVETIYLYLAELEFLDSAGLGVLVGLKMTANKNRTRLVFLAPPPRVEEIFRVSKLETIFEIRSGVEAATIKMALLKRENCLWLDHKDIAQQAYVTQSDAVIDDEAGRLTQVPQSEEAGQVSRDVQQLCQEAVEHIHQGNFEKAISTYLQALRLQPDNLSALNNLGIVYEKRPEWYPRARQIWQQVLEISRQRRDERHMERARKHLELLAKMMPDA